MGNPDLKDENELHEAIDRTSRGYFIVVVVGSFLFICIFTWLFIIKWRAKDTKRNVLVQIAQLWITSVINFTSQMVAVAQK